MATKEKDTPKTIFLRMDQHPARQRKLALIKTQMREKTYSGALQRMIDDYGSGQKIIDQLTKEIHRKNLIIEELNQIINCFEKYNDIHKHIKRINELKKHTK